MDIPERLLIVWRWSSTYVIGNNACTMYQYTWLLV